MFFLDQHLVTVVPALGRRVTSLKNLRVSSLVFQNPPVIPCEDRCLDPLKTFNFWRCGSGPTFNTDPHKVWLEDVWVISKRHFCWWMSRESYEVHRCNPESLSVMNRLSTTGMCCRYLMDTNPYMSRLDTSRKYWNKPTYYQLTNDRYYHHFVHEIICIYLYNMYAQHVKCVSIFQRIYVGNVYLHFPLKWTIFDQM